MRKAVLFAAVLAGSLCLAPQGHADQKSDDVGTLLKITGQNTSAMEARVSQQVHLILQSFISAHPDLTGAEVVSMQTQVAAVENQFIAKMGDETVAHYDAALTDDQIRAVIAFYGSPAGAAYLAATQSLAQVELEDVRRDVPVMVRQIMAILLAALRGHSATSPQPQAG